MAGSDLMELCSDCYLGELRQDEDTSSYLEEMQSLAHLP